MRKITYIMLFVPVWGMLAISCGQPKKNIDHSVKNRSNGNPSILLNVNEFESGLMANPNAQLIDVRTPGEYQRGHIKGAINIDYQGNHFTEEIAKLDKTKPTYVYCQSGGRSAEACNYMSNQNFVKLYELNNGFSSWAHYKKPIEITEQE